MNHNYKIKDFKKPEFESDTDLVDISVTVCLRNSLELPSILEKRLEDIINNLISNNADKPLSAKQGRVLKSLIDAIIVPTKLSELENDSGFLTEHQVNNLIDAKLTGVETLLGGGF